jgi:DNA helicase-2/ATP-dependent DNA helicase PcrA
MRAANKGTSATVDKVTPGSGEMIIIEEELRLLAQVQKQLAAHQIGEVVQKEYDRELISLRDQIAEARTEDLAPLIAEMYRLQAVGANTDKGRSLPVDAKSPYFGHLKLSDRKKTRDVLIGSRGFVTTGSSVAIVDWRNAPVSRIYYCYDEGDDYDENFGGRSTSGMVVARRTVSIVDGELRRVAWSGGSVARRGDGSWVAIPIDQRPTLKGGAGAATRPPEPGKATFSLYKGQKGKLGVVGDESLREDKHLKEITALIDPTQFKAITQPESGIVILQGGAGSGKTTVALHRAAYLHFQDPQTFSPKKMAIVVKSAPLTEYISRVLPSLDVHGTQVVTLNDFMSKTRKKVMPELKKGDIADVPAAVARLKKHPGVLHLLEESVRHEAELLGQEMVEKADMNAKKAVETRWAHLQNLALVPRIREMTKWLEGAAADRAGLTNAGRGAVLGVLRRAKGSAQDVTAAWAELLTDAELVKSAIEKKKSGGPVSDQEIEELVKWVSQQADELPEVEEDEDDEPEAFEEDKKAAAKRRKERMEAESVLGQRVISEPMNGAEHDGDDEDPVDHRLGIDGRLLDEGSPRGKLDENDDALLLRLKQLKIGGLPIPGSAKSVTYEHVIVDEAQDLSPADISVLRGSLTKRESMTLAGDTAQKLIFDNGFDDWDSMLEDVGITGVKIEQLRISYRSTKEIVDFSRHVLGPLADPEQPVVPRSGAPVEQFRFGSTGEAIAFLGEALRSLLIREKKANVAVIARYAALANIYYEGLKKSEIPALRRVYGKEFTFQPGIDVVDVAQVKGLEYDYIILVEVNANVYGDTREARHLLHIASTRAVHQLWVTSVGDVSPLLPSESL